MKSVIRTPDFPIVTTRQGKLHGFWQDGVFHFHGIRYGTAERFELPRPEQPWEGVRDAKAYGYVCPLMPDNMAAQTSVNHEEADRDNPMAPPFSSFEMPHVYWPMSEQCLYLNVWTKHLDENAKRPVMVWLHGGGFAAGSSIEIPAYDGHNLSAYGDVVIVNINHRLNCLGFLDLSSYGESYKYSGCVGMADVVLALQWVQENIAAFGGDPSNVTVAGQSGGGGKAALLLQMPVADGLYHKVISQSGALRSRPDAATETEKHHWQALGKKTAQILGLDENTIDEIRSIPYEKLSLAAEQAGRELGMPSGLMLFEPSSTEGLFEGLYCVTGFRKETAHIPVMAGTVLGEFAFMHYLGDKTSYIREQKLELLRGAFGEDTERIVELFEKAYPGKDILYAWSVDTMFRPNTIRFLDARRTFLDEQKNGADCWNYQMSFVIPYMGGLAPWHCGDIPFVFRNVEMEPAHCTGTKLPDTTTELPKSVRDQIRELSDGYVERLQDQISDAWLAFMEKGDPSTEKLSWVPYTIKDRARMNFAETSEMTAEDDRELMELVQKHSWMPF